MLRALTLAAGLGLAVVATTPASAAVKLYCVSADTSCQSWSCPAGTTTVFDNGWYDTGPWIVICRPKV